MSGLLNIKNDEDKKKQFGPNQELSIISIIFDEPEFYPNIAQYLTVDSFNNIHCQYVFSIINDYYEKHGVVITRNLCRDEILNNLTADDPYKEILEIVDRRSDVREIPIIKDNLVEWARKKAYSQIYSEDSIFAYENGDYDKIYEIIESARKITDKISKGLWFFDQLDTLFIEESEIKLTCGFQKLDSIINEGGPTYGDTFCWMAPTGVGKSLMLINSAAGCLKKGLNVVYITLELSDFKSALRMMGALSDIPIKKRMDFQGNIRKSLEKFKNTYNSELVIYEFPPNDISIDNINLVLDELRRNNGFRVDVVVIDYLELLLSNVSAYNTVGNEYTRQKQVSTEIRQFSKKNKVLTFTASQTNRSSNSNANVKSGKGEEKSSQSIIDLNQVAESYGKTMPMDYVVTINQSREEYMSGYAREGDENSPNINAACRFYIAKNRNGPKCKTISAKINYETMRTKVDDYY